MTYAIVKTLCTDGITRYAVCPSCDAYTSIVCDYMEYPFATQYIHTIAREHGYETFDFREHESIEY
jgi:hypothetical protein